MAREPETHETVAEALDNARSAARAMLAAEREKERAALEFMEAQARAENARRDDQRARARLAAAINAEAEEAAP